MTDELKSSDGAETPSTATPETNDTEPIEKPSPTMSDSTSHIVDDTEKWLRRSIIITGAPEPKK